MEIYMKKIILILTMTLSMSTFANGGSVFRPTVQITLLPFASIAATTAGLATSSGNECKFLVCKEAAQVLVDGQEYAQSGKMTAFLAGKISNVKSSDESLSTEEALDVLVDTALEILK
jgi:hypothetical protein